MRCLSRVMCMVTMLREPIALDALQLLHQASDYFEMMLRQAELRFSGGSRNRRLGFHVRNTRGPAVHVACGRRALDDRRTQRPGHAGLVGRQNKT